MAKHKLYHLTARQDFGAYRKGEHIEDHAEVERILGGEHAVHVVRVAADKEPEDQGEAKPPALPQSAKADVADAK